MERTRVGIPSAPSNVEHASAKTGGSRRNTSLEEEDGIDKELRTFLVR